jgi:hypothetical protein
MVPRERPFEEVEFVAGPWDGKRAHVMDSENRIKIRMSEVPVRTVILKTHQGYPLIRIGTYARDLHDRFYFNWEGEV